MMHRIYKKIRATLDERGQVPTLRRGGPAACFLFLFGVAVDAAATPGGIGGDFSMIGMAHTPDAPAATDVRPWDGHGDGTFAYRAMSCSASAAHVNNNSSDLPSYNARIPGSRVPASTRANPMQFTVKEGSVQGTIDLTVCQLAPGAVADDRDDEEREKIFIEFEATPERYSAEEAALQGEFRITGGTGPYSDLSGQGDIRAYFFCYSAEGCQRKKTLYRDSLFVMQGSYFDPTGLTAASKGRAEDSGSGDAHMH
jgi:hypothetical protein